MKNEVFHEGFLQQVSPYPQETADLVTFTAEILNGKLNFLRSGCSKIQKVSRYRSAVSNKTIPLTRQEFSLQKKLLYKS